MSAPASYLWRALADREDERLDHFLRRSLPDAERAGLQQCFERAEVWVNGRPARKGQRLRQGDEVGLLHMPSSRHRSPRPNPGLPLEVHYEDADLLIVEKPAGMHCHPLHEGDDDTLVSALLARYPEIRGVGFRDSEPGIVHRLDRNTSGLMMVARHEEAFRALKRDADAQVIRKGYLALCSGAGELRAGETLRFCLLADPSDPRRVLALPEGAPLPSRAKAARPRERSSRILSLTRIGEFKLVEIEITRGFRHQIRAQLAASGHPIVGDALYGGFPLPSLSRHFLHAATLDLPHPRSATRLHVQSPLPEELRVALDALRTRA